MAIHLKQPSNIEDCNNLVNNYKAWLKRTLKKEMKKQGIEAKISIKNNQSGYNTFNA